MRLSRLLIALALVTVPPAAFADDPPEPAAADASDDAASESATAPTGGLSGLVLSASGSSVGSSSAAPAPAPPRATGSFHLGSTCVMRDLSKMECTMPDGTVMACTGLIMHPLLGPQCTSTAPLIVPTP